METLWTKERLKSRLRHLSLPFAMASVLWAALGACSDTNSPNLPPPRQLTAEQEKIVSAHLLKSMPEGGVTFAGDAALGQGAIRYLGTEILTQAEGKEGRKSLRPEADGRPPAVRRGEKLTVRHYFEALDGAKSKLDQNGWQDVSWKLFVHGGERPKRRGQKARNVINADHVPVQGLWPTFRWRSGEIVADEYEVTVPDTSPHMLSLYVGFYRVDGRRLAVDDASNHDGANRILAGTLRVEGDARPLPVYRAARRTSPITLDGKLDEDAWKAAAGTGPLGRSLDGKAPHSRTEAKILWDDEALYVAFDMDDEDIWGTLRERDAAIYGEEVVEVFIDADGDGKTYNELELSPHEVIFDAYFPARRKGMDLSWDSQMTGRVSVRGTLDDGSDTDDGWSAELKIPVKNLASVPHWPPRPGDRWRFNLYRLDWHSDRKRNEGQAFSPLFIGDFHHLPRFGILEFEGAVPPPSTHQEAPGSPAPAAQENTRN